MIKRIPEEFIRLVRRVHVLEIGAHEEQIIQGNQAGGLDHCARYDYAIAIHED